MEKKKVKIHFNFTLSNNILYPTHIALKFLASTERINNPWSINSKMQQANAQWFCLAKCLLPNGTTKPLFETLHSYADPPGKRLSQHRKKWALYQGTYHNDLCHYLMVTLVT